MFTDIIIAATAKVYTIVQSDGFHPSIIHLLSQLYAVNKIFLEERRLQECGAVQILCESTFRRNVSPPASGSAVSCSRCFSLADFSTLKMEAIHSSETSVHTRSTRRHVPEDDVLRSHRCENLKSYKICLEFYLLGYNAMYSIESQPTFRKNTSPS
jgi:hypothetical protein